jgi:hypothetical protein
MRMSSATINSEDENAKAGNTIGYMLSSRLPVLKLRTMYQLPRAPAWTGATICELFGTTPDYPLVVVGRPREGGGEVVA